jgi:hypothetical protein
MLKYLIIQKKEGTNLDFSLKLVKYPILYELSNRISTIIKFIFRF